jgi:hypothetical protein
MDEQESIEKARIGFEVGFAEGSYYNWQTQDQDQLVKYSRRKPS